MVETRAELSFIGDHVVYLSHNQAARSGPRMTALLDVSAAAAELTVIEGRQ